MEEVMNMLKKIQKDLNEQKTTISQSANKITEQVTQNINHILEEKFKAIDVRYENLKEKLENQEKRLYFLEKQSRQRNIVIFGLAETETSYANLEKTVLKFIHQYFSIVLENRDIQEIRRLGKKGEKPRPITVTFTSLGTKIEIFKQRRALKDTTYYIKEDFPQHILEKRRLLREQIKVEKEKGNKAVIKYDKLVILNKPSTSKNNKRSLSTSPSEHCIRQGNSQHKAQATKKNRPTTEYNDDNRPTTTAENIVKPGILNFLVNKNPTSQSQSINNLKN
ncbi:unnamed protein product [Euphydryas editha]|uniref:Endonuclease-reverse transcriptase n=1 Tax=Euphydryas editha TaxID=104508 RepID=A0AAU9UUG6_EUPED|nr:unnamed protein product [Euphydryas editha]